MSFIFFGEYGGKWYWKRNRIEAIAWSACAKHLNLPNELVEKISSYLFDATYFHSACSNCMKNATWLPEQPQWAKSRNMSVGTASCEWVCSITSNDCHHKTPLTYPIPVMLEYLTSIQIN